MEIMALLGLLSLGLYFLSGWNEDTSWFGRRGFYFWLFLISGCLTASIFWTNCFSSLYQGKLWFYSSLLLTCFAIEITRWLGEKIKRYLKQKKEVLI